MGVNDILLQIDAMSAANKLDRPYIVGGVPRDRVMSKTQASADVNDIDITTGSKDSLILPKLIAQQIDGAVYRTYDDGHSSVDILGIHFDFSSNFIIPNMKQILEGMGVKDITTLKMELYSRDFTMNTLLETLDFGKMYDLTKEGVDDINSKIIKCPIDANITIGTDPRRILRAIKYSVKYDFVIEDSLKNAMMLNREKIKTLPQKFVMDKMNEIVRLDADRGIDLLIEYKLLPLVPLSKMISDTLIQKRKLLRAL